MNNREKFNNRINVSGEKIRQAKKKKKISRERMSSELMLKLNIDIPAQSIAKIENDTRTVVDYELWGIAKILEIDMKDLIKI